MRQVIKRALQKLNKLTAEQIKDLLVAAAEEIDRFETVLDSLNEGVLVCDSSHNLIMANKCARRILPLSSFEQGKEPLWTLLGDEKAAEFLAATLKAGDKAEGREFDVEAKGIQRLLSISVMPLVQDRHVSGSLVFVEDITERRSREARLRRIENLASLTTLAAGVAHEIKNPLGSLSIHAQLMQKTMTANKKLYFSAHPEETMESETGPAKYLRLLDNYIAVVNEEIARLNRIVVDFLFAVRPMNLDLRMGNINALIEDLAAFVLCELEEAHIECRLELDENIPPVEFDGGQMKQALLNLIKNAMAAMPGGGVLTIRTKTAEGEIAVTVQDTGIGISDTNMPKIFEPYFTTRETGFGLGLTMVFKIIREHRGEIAVKSREGEGSSFTITLPIPQRERRLIEYGGRSPEELSHEV
jgi:PAS domain S-box-containing protein